MTNYNELCSPFIEASKACALDEIHNLEPKLKELDFFEALPNLKNYADFNKAVKNPKLQAFILKAAELANISFKDCDAPAINLDGEIVPPTLEYVDAEGTTQLKWNNAGKLIHCSRLVEALDEDGTYYSLLEANGIIELLNRNGFDIQLIELPNYSNSEIVQMFNL
jgi:hypothetical protein